MKAMADALTDLGEPVQDRTCAEHPARPQQVIPVHVTAHHPPKAVPAVHRRSCRPSPCRTQHGATHDASFVSRRLVRPQVDRLHDCSWYLDTLLPPPTIGGGSSSKDPSRRRRGGRGQGGSAPGFTGGPQWPSLLNPWTGSIHMWPGSTPGGAHGPPRVGPSPPQAMMADTPPPDVFYPTAPGAYFQPQRRPLPRLCGTRNPSPTPSAPSPSTHLPIPLTGFSTPAPLPTSPPTLVWSPCPLPRPSPPPSLWVMELLFRLLALATPTPLVLSVSTTFLLLMISSGTFFPLDNLPLIIVSPLNLILLVFCEGPTHQGHPPSL
jgi:hypothetical protein